MSYWRCFTSGSLNFLFLTTINWMYLITLWIDWCILNRFQSFKINYPSDTRKYFGMGPALFQLQRRIQGKQHPPPPIGKGNFFNLLRVFKKQNLKTPKFSHSYKKNSKTPPLKIFWIRPRSAWFWIKAWKLWDFGNTSNKLGILSLSFQAFLGIRV